MECGAHCMGSWLVFIFFFSIHSTEPENMLPEEGREPTGFDIEISERVVDPKDSFFDHVKINREVIGYYDRWYIDRITW